MPEQPSPQAAELEVNLKDPVIAGFLAWLIPGLGHFYQGRYAKGGVFSICILATFFYGLYLGANPEVGWGRVVYLSFRPNDLRLAYLCQVGAGLPALPALIQANRVYSGKDPLWKGFMAPPKLNPNDPGTVTLKDLSRHFPRFFELGTVYTMVAGLLNILAVYDACCGPVTAPPIDEENRGKDGKKGRKENEADDEDGDAEDEQ